MTSIDRAEASSPPDRTPWEVALLDLVELVERRLEPTQGDTEEARALRRTVSGRPRPHDFELLNGRFRGSRLCLVRATPAYAAAVKREATTVAGVIVDVAGSDVLLLVPGLPRHASAGPDDRLTRMLTRIFAVAPTAMVGSSTILDTPTAAPRGLDEATRALVGCQPGKSVLAEDVWFDLALSRMRDSLKDSLAVGGPLALLDSLRSGADLRQSLTAWLQADGDTRLAAERLHMHPNTLRYRLRRAQEITGSTWRTPCSGWWRTSPSPVERRDPHRTLATPVARRRTTTVLEFCR